MLRRLAFLLLAVALACPVGAVSELNWLNYPSATSYLTTELNSLASAGNKIGAAIDNTSAGDMFADFEVVIATQGGARSAGAYIALYVIPSVDGTNYTMGDDSVDPPATTMVCAIPLDAATTARRIACTHVLIPAGKFKVLLENNTGQAFASSGNTLAYTIYNVESQ